MIRVMWRVSDRVHISVMKDSDFAREFKRVVEGIGGMCILETEIPPAWREAMDAPDDVAELPLTGEDVIP